MNRSYFIPIVALVESFAAIGRCILETLGGLLSALGRVVVELLKLAGTADRIANAREPLQLSARDSAATLRRRLEARRNHFASIDRKSHFFGSVRASPA